MKLAHRRHLATLLEASFVEHAERVALVGPRGEKLTYQELGERSHRVASFVRGRGIFADHRVGHVFAKSLNSVVALVGVLRAGAAYVPVDARAPDPRNETVLQDAEVSLILNEASLRDALRAPPTDLDTAARNASDPAYVLYTSGSTGTPKGVVLSHDNATSFVAWARGTFHPTPEDRFSSHAPFHFDLSIFDLYVALTAGASVHLIDEQTAQSPRHLVRFVEHRALTVWYSTPSVLQLMLEHGQLAKAKEPSLRLLCFAGEVFPVGSLRALQSAWPRPRYFNLYGPTETNVCTFSEIPHPIPSERKTPFPIGQVCSHCDALVLDEAGTPVGPGQEGLLHISGTSVFGGYWKRPSLDAQAFVERSGTRFYNTGDVVRETPQGYVFVGRRDRMVKRRGYRIELGEIEQALNACPRIREAAVEAKDSPEGVRILALVVFRGEPMSIIELKQHCVDSLINYMVPDAFVGAAELPRTSTDKVDYPALSRLARPAVSRSEHAISNIGESTKRQDGLQLERIVPTRSPDWIIDSVRT